MFASLLAFQIIAALVGGLYAVFLCWLVRRSTPRPAPFKARQLLNAALLQLPVGLLLLALSHVLFRVQLLPSMGFFLVIGLLFYAGFLWMPLGALRFALARKNIPGRSPLPPVGFLLRTVFLVYVVLFWSVGFYAWFIEPSEIKISQHSVPLDGVRSLPERGLRIVHISDIQTSYLGSRELMVGPAVEELKPDLVLFTGDLFTRAMFGEAPQDSAHTVLAGLSAPFGFFGVTGDAEEPEETAEILATHGYTLLRNELRKFSVRGQKVVVVGLDRLAPDLSVLDRVPDEEALVILITHSPDVILDLGLDLEAPFLSLEERVRRSRDPAPPRRFSKLPDLILAGHTHGGQICVPGWGAPITFTKIGTRYASGLFDFGETVLHISRGLGMEGHFAPRVRFLCPPEITLIRPLPPDSAPEEVSPSQ